MRSWMIPTKIVGGQMSFGKRSWYLDQSSSVPLGPALKLLLPHQGLSSLAKPWSGKWQDQEQEGGWCQAQNHQVRKRCYRIIK